MSATAAVARMLTLIPWLLERPGASIAEIAETFDTTSAAIRSDLAHLDFCGLPGLGGGDLFEVDTIGDRVLVRMADELKRPLRPTAAEALRLVLTVDAVAAVLGDEVPALHAAIAKIRTALAIPESAADVLDAAPAPATELRRAVREGHQVALVYQRRDGSAPTDRVVDPWALSLVDGTWYLQGFDHGAEAARTFRLDRMLRHEVLPTPRALPPPDDLPAPAYVAGPDDTEVVLDVTVRGRWLLDAITPERVEDRPDGGARVVLRTDSPPWLARLVLMAGGDAVVESPSVIAQEVQRLAMATLATY